MGERLSFVIENNKINLRYLKEFINQYTKQQMLVN